MKWIDDQDDYFLRDFNSGKDRPSGNTDSTDTGNASAPAEPTPPAGGRQEADTPGEFTFPATSVNPGGDGGTPSAASETDSDKTRRQRRRRRHRRLAWFLIIVFAVAAVAFYIRYFVPYTSDTLTTGYIMLVEKRGIFFKTFEGEMISESMLADTSKVYSRDFYFSIPDDSLGRVMQSYQGTGKRVTVTTQRYFGTLPWRGSQKSVVTDIKAAN